MTTGGCKKLERTYSEARRLGLFVAAASLQQTSTVLDASAVRATLLPKLQ